MLLFSHDSELWMKICSFSRLLRCFSGKDRFRCTKMSCRKPGVALVFVTTDSNEQQVFTVLFALCSLCSDFTLCQPSKKWTQPFFKKGEKQAIMNLSWSCKFLMFHKCRGWEIERVIWGGSWGFYNNSPKIGAHTHTVCVCVYCVCECKYLCVSSVYCHGLCAAGSGCDSALEAVLAGNCSIHDQIRLLSCTPHIFGTFRNIGHMTLWIWEGC